MLDVFRDRIQAKKPLRIRGGGSKDFYGGPLVGDVLDTRGYAGIVNYEPTELVITVKSGTSLSELNPVLAEQRQFLPFEAPSFGGESTVGGIVAAGLSGPRRMTAGSVRDFVLGVRLMDGEGRELKFGGEVMKNVAGYDVSRLMAGSLGTLGLLLEVSLKVLPLPVAEASLRLELPQDKALELMNSWAGKPLPVSATCWNDGCLTVRLSGAESAVRAAQASLGGDTVTADEASTFWNALRQHQAAFFAGDAPLWRLAVPSIAPPLALPGSTLIEWNGAQRWVRGEMNNDAQQAAVHDAATAAGGHARLFRGASTTQRAAGVFRPLTPPLLELHRRIKRVFDPHGVFNPGRMYGEF